MKQNLPVLLLKELILLPSNDIRLEFDNDISSSIIDVAYPATSPTFLTTIS